LYEVDFPSVIIHSFLFSMPLSPCLHLREEIVTFTNYTFLSVSELLIVETFRDPNHKFKFHLMNSGWSINRCDTVEERTWWSGMLAGAQRAQVLREI